MTSGSIQDRVDHYLSINCFAPAPNVPNSAGTGTLAPTGYGNVPRNAFRGPRQQSWDFSIAKHFKIRERHAIDFRTDFFNIFNHPSFRAPAFVSINTPGSFGQINNTVTPARLIQFGLRYSF